MDFGGAAAIGGAGEGFDFMSWCVFQPVIPLIYEWLPLLAGGVTKALIPSHGSHFSQKLKSPSHLILTQVHGYSHNLSSILHRSVPHDGRMRVGHYQSLLSVFQL